MSHNDRFESDGAAVMKNPNARADRTRDVPLRENVLQARLDADIERVASQDVKPASVLRVRARSDSEEVELDVRSDEVVHATVFPAFGLPPDSRALKGGSRAQIIFGGEPVLPEETFRDHGIEDGARLYVSHTVPSVEQIVTELLVLNPGLSRHRATRQNEGKGMHRVDPQNPRRILGSWDLDHLGLTSLPDSLSSLIIDGDLLLSRNQLSSLPRDFGEISVGGSLDLSHNRIESLPASFGDLTVGGAGHSGPVLMYNPIADLERKRQRPTFASGLTIIWGDEDTVSDEDDSQDSWTDNYAFPLADH